MGETQACEQKEGVFSSFLVAGETINLLKGCLVAYAFPIQVKIFGSAYEEKGLIVQDQRGMGKIFSFVIPVKERLQRTQEVTKELPT